MVGKAKWAGAVDGSDRGGPLRYGRLRVASRGSIQNLWLLWSRAGLAAIAWSETDLRQYAGRVSGGEAAPEKAAVPERFARELRGYFAGEPVDLVGLPVDPRGSAFQLSVWQELRRIPRGSVRSYGEIAARIGRPGAARAVGGAAGANPLPVVVPCHRLLAGGMRIGGYSGGLGRKRALLSLEGVRAIDGGGGQSRTSCRSDMRTKRGK